MLECSVSNALVYQHMKYEGNREQLGFYIAKIIIIKVLILIYHHSVIFFLLTTLIAF